MKKNVMKNLDTIKEKRTISNEKKKMISNKLISNFVIGISFIILVLIYYLVKSFLDKSTAEMIYHISSMVFIIVTIITFEISYKKKKSDLGLNGVELLIVSTYSLFSPYVYYKYNKIAIAFVSALAVYYSIKTIVIYNKEKAKIEREHDDIGTIIKKESQDELVKEYKEKKETKKDYSIKYAEQEEKTIDEDEDDYDETVEEYYDDDIKDYSDINGENFNDKIDEEVDDRDIADIKLIDEEPEEIIELVKEKPKEMVKEEKEKVPVKTKSTRKKKAPKSTIIPKEFVGKSPIENPLVEDKPKFEEEGNVEIKPSSKPEIIIVTTKSKPTRAQQTHVKKTNSSTTKKTSGTTKKTTTKKSTTTKKGASTRKPRTSKTKDDK